MPLAHRFHGHTCTVPQFLKTSLFFTSGIVFCRSLAALREMRFPESLHSQVVCLDDGERGQDLIFLTDTLTWMQTILNRYSNENGVCDFPDFSSVVQNDHSRMP